MGKRKEDKKKKHEAEEMRDLNDGTGNAQVHRPTTVIHRHERQHQQSDKLLYNIKLNTENAEQKSCINIQIFLFGCAFGARY